MIETRKANSLSTVLQEVRAICDAWADGNDTGLEVWYRGNPRKWMSLIPGAYRVDDDSEFDEFTLFEKFKARATPFADSRIRSEWDWYFLAQHHGLQTRLLDWTKNLLTAVYFAVREHAEDPSRLKDEARDEEKDDDDGGSELPVVWLLEAGSLNSYATGNKSGDFVISPGGEITQKYLPGTVMQQTPANRYPLSILPTYTNQRIAAQQGLFTLHGHDKTSIDGLADNTQNSTIKLARILLAKESVDAIWKDLGIIGVNRLSVFPELDSVAFITRS